MTPVIRRARPGDHLLIRELQQEVAALHYEGRPDLFQKEGRYYSEEAFARLLAKPDEFIWIAEADGKAVGYAFALVQRARNNATFRDFNRFYIDDVCVSSACQRQGIGRLLMEECKQQARRSHCHTIDLGVWSFNHNAIAFYESCGLKERERRMELILPDEEMIDVSGTVLETDRLILRPFRETDLEDFYAYASVEGVGEMAGWPHHTSMETSRRVLDSFIRLPNGANAAFYELRALSHPGAGAVTVIPRYRGIGTVGVVVSTMSGETDAALIAEIQQDLDAVREIAVDVTVMAPTVRTVDVALKLWPKSGVAFDTAKQAVQEALETYFTGKLLGKSVYLAALGSVIYATGVAENYAISQPAADFAGEKTVLPRLGTLTITEGA